MPIQLNNLISALIYIILQCILYIFIFVQFHLEELFDTLSLQKGCSTHMHVCLDTHTHTEALSLSWVQGWWRRWLLKTRDEVGEKRRVGWEKAKVLSNAIVNCNIRQTGEKKLKHTALLEHSSYLAHHLWRALKLSRK